MSSDEDVHWLRDEVSGDEEIEATVRRLRQDGHSRLEALRLILDALDVSLSEAKMLLLTSDTWNEARTEAGAESESESDREASSGMGATDDSIPPAPG